MGHFKNLMGHFNHVMFVVIGPCQSSHSSANFAGVGLDQVSVRAKYFHGLLPRNLLGNFCRWIYQYWIVGGATLPHASRLRAAVSLRRDWYSFIMDSESKSD